MIRELYLCVLFICVFDNMNGERMMEWKGERKVQTTKQIHKTYIDR